MGQTRTDHWLLAATLVPLPLVGWLPPWDAAIFAHGLAGAVILCVSAAVLEEVVFRGVLQGGLLRRASLRATWLRLSRANWLTSALFALAHIGWHPLLLVPGYLVVSLVLGYFRERHHGILVPVLLHAYYNLVLLFAPMLLGNA